MKTNLTHIQQLGIGLFIVSIFIYFLVPSSQLEFEGLSLINYALAGFYFLISFGDTKKGSKFYKLKIPKLNWHLTLAIMFISCFTLNKSIKIFSPAANWLNVFIVIILIAYIISAICLQIPSWARHLASLLLGFSIALYTYYTIALLPYSPIGVIGLFLLGISIHLLIPAFLLGTSISVALSKKHTNISSLYTLIGLILALVFTIIYSSLYHYNFKQIESAQKEIVLNEVQEFPEWVNYAQKCSSPFWANRIIGEGFLYDTYSKGWWSWDLNNTSFREIKRHDPLVATAALFTNKVSLSFKEKSKILDATSNTRHYSYEKLWSGKDLIVTKELSDIRLYPDYRLAYLEKNIWIENTNTWEGNQQEALFTFYLPEGAVATSLSLWIDGVEEKSRLSTRKKADTAYKTIVGQERRDPVVLHWQEGNRLTATVFPCTPKEARRMKLGLTIPLNKNNNDLMFNKLKIQGSDNAFANETIHLKIIGKAEQVKLPYYFSKEKDNQFYYEGKTIEDWTCTVASVPLSTKAFLFNGYSYQVESQETISSFTPNAIYLDLNSEWSINEVETILQRANGISVYIYDNTFTEINSKTYYNIVKPLLRKPFSLFPTHKISDRGNALLISKGKTNSPIPSDLKKSKFYNDFVLSMGKLPIPIASLIIDDKKSSYVSSLEQYNLLRCQTTDLTTFGSTPVSKWFSLNTKDYGASLPMAQMKITRSKSTTNNDVNVAPSHLMRLYNYHTILQEAGHLFLQDKEDIPDNIYELCNAAFIVTPISSLIVLETIKDYERFDIAKNKNSLHNASLQDSGAVPEPGEWALIISLIVIVGFTYFKFRK